MYTAAIITFLTLLIISTTISATNAALSVTLTPSSGEPGDSIQVEGTDFAATNTVGIGLGPEVAVTDESVNVTGAGVGPWTGVLANRPIKPGSFSMISNTSGVEVEYWDNGDGTLGSASSYFVSGIINYTSGVFNRVSTTDLSGYTLLHTVNYTCYAFDVTPAEGVPTDASGAFTVNFTVPDIWNGTEPLTVIDEEGHVATSDFTIYGSDVVPEPLTIGAIVLLSSAALVVSFYCLRKRSYTKGTAH